MLSMLRAFKNTCFGKIYTKYSIFSFSYLMTSMRNAFPIHTLPLGFSQHIHKGLCTHVKEKYVISFQILTSVIRNSTRIDAHVRKQSNILLPAMSTWWSWSEGSCPTSPNVLYFQLRLAMELDCHSYCLCLLVTFNMKHTQLLPSAVCSGPTSRSAPLWCLLLPSLEHCHPAIKPLLSYASLCVRHWKQDI